MRFVRMKSTDMALPEHPLGFRYAPRAWSSGQAPNRRRACFRVRKVLEGIVYDTVALEGNPFTFPEVKTLLDGITVGGHRLEDERQVLNQAASWKALLAMVEGGSFALDKETFCALNALVAKEEALRWGVFRDGDVTIAGTDCRPPPWQELDTIFERGLAALQALPSVHERAVATFLFGALRQFFYDGNRRTARLMMNGILLAAGEDAITIPAAKRLAFNTAMIRFYESLDGTEMMAFMGECSLDRAFSRGARGACPLHERSLQPGSARGLPLA